MDLRVKIDVETMKPARKVANENVFLLPSELDDFELIYDSTAMHS